MTEFEALYLEELHLIREALQIIAGNNTLDMRMTGTSVEKAQSSLSKDEDISQMQIQNQTNSFSENKRIKRYYFGTPDGTGFEDCNMIEDLDNPKVLYVLETEDGKNGKFYPLEKGLARFKNNAKSMLLPLCDLSIPIEELQSFNISLENYGEVKLENNFWIVKKKCVI